MVEMNMESRNRELLSDAISKINEHYGRIIKDPITKIDLHPQTFLKSCSIYKINHMNPYKPVLFYVGLDPDQPSSVFLLTSNQENFVRLAKADPFVIDSDTVVAYAKTYLDVTRSMSTIFYVVDRISDIKFRPNLDSDDEELKSSFFQRFRTLVKPPEPHRAENDSFNLVIYAVRGQSLERHSMTIDKRKDIKDEIVVLVNDLPLVYGI